MIRLLPALSVALLWGGTAAASVCGPFVVVAPGDTMNKIAARCGVTSESVQAANPTVDPYRMAVGQQLSIDPNAVLPGLPGNRPPDPDGDGPFLSWLELGPGEVDPTLSGGTGPQVGTGIVQTALPPPGSSGTGAAEASEIASDAVAALGATGGVGGLAPAAPSIVADAPTTGTPPVPGAVDPVSGPELASVGPINPYDPVLAAQVPPFPITTDLGTPPRPTVVRSSPARRAAPAPQRARPQRAQPVIRLTRSQARAALQAIRSGQRSGTIGGLNLADPAARRALRRALGQ